MSASLEEKFHQLQNEYNSLQNRYQSVENEHKCAQQTIEKLNARINELNQSTKEEQKTYDADMIANIKEKVRADPDSIKQMVRKKKIGINDQIWAGRTLLMISSYYGSYKVAQFCINSGADLNIKDKWKDTALDIARDNGYYNIEQLLLFAKLHLNVGTEIKNTAQTIHEQNGIIENIVNGLQLIGQQSKDLFEKILLELMTNLINEKLIFSDNLLNVCWNIICRDDKDPLSSDLWKIISTQCKNIIENGNQRDWFWLKKCLLTSTIWFKNISISNEDDDDEKKQKTENIQNKVHYLYYELLVLVDIEAQNQLNQLEKDLNTLSNKHTTDWDKLIKWNIPDQYPIVRQDVIPNGIVSQYTYNQLSESSGATFNSPKFYDYNQYLSQLVLLSQIVDEDFQKSVQDMFNIDKVTNEGIISFDNDFEGEEIKTKEKVGDGKINYVRGPVKLMERAKYKAQNDYSDQDYPASGCILDLNRCCLIFNDISTLLRAIRLFVNKVNYYQSGNIIGIVRDKNLFIDYVVSGTQYADIKLNVLIKGKHNNIIGEVQFLLRIMKQFKDKAHHLYGIQRKRESIENSVSQILPILLNDKKRLFSAAIGGNVSELCKLMVISNMTHTDLMKVDPDTQNTILHRICTKNRFKAFVFLRSLIPINKFIDYLFESNHFDIKPIEYSIRYSAVSIAEMIFNMEEVKTKYEDNDSLYRLLFWLLANNQNEYLIDYMLSVLKISNDKLIKFLKYKCKMSSKKFANSGAIRYHRYNLLHETISGNRLKIIKKLVSIIGIKSLTHNIFIDDDYHQNGLECVLKNGEIKKIKYILSFKDIKDELCKSDKLLWRLLYHLFVRCKNKNIRDYVLSELDSVKHKFAQLVIQRYKGSDGTFGKNSHKYEYYSIAAMLVFNTEIDNLRDLALLIGNKMLCGATFLKDRWKGNAIKYAIEKGKIDMLEYMLKINDIKTKCIEDKDEFQSILSTLNENFNESIAQCMIRELKLTETKLNEFDEAKKILDLLHL